MSTRSGSWCGRHSRSTRGRRLSGRCGVHRGRGTRPRDGRTGVSGTIRTAVKPPRKDPVSTGRAARRLRSGWKPCMGLWSSILERVPTTVPFPFAPETFHNAAPSCFSTSAFLPVCGRAVVLLVACGDDASKPPNKAPVAVGTPPVLEIIAEQAVTVVDRQLQALGLRYRTGPLPRSAWRSARPDRSP